MRVDDHANQTPLLFCWCPVLSARAPNSSQPPPTSTLSFQPLLVCQNCTLPVRQPSTWQPLQPPTVKLDNCGLLLRRCNSCILTTGTSQSRESTADRLVQLRSSHAGPAGCMHATEHSFLLPWCCLSVGILTPKRTTSSCLALFLMLLHITRLRCPLLVLWCPAGRLVCRAVRATAAGRHVPKGRDVDHH